MRKRRSVAYILALSMMCGAMPGTVCFANETEEPVLIEAESLGNADDNEQNRQDAGADGIKRINPRP